MPRASSRARAPCSGILAELSRDGKKKRTFARDLDTNFRARPASVIHPTSITTPRQRTTTCAHRIDSCTEACPSREAPVSRASLRPNARGHFCLERASVRTRDTTQVLRKTSCLKLPPWQIGIRVAYEMPSLRFVSSIFIHPVARARFVPAGNESAFAREVAGVR